MSEQPNSTSSHISAGTATAGTSPQRGEVSSHERDLKSRRRLALYFGFLLLWLFALVMVGGTVRLTGSGMSIPDWPIIYYGPDRTQGSILPPFSQEAWETVHETYHVEYLSTVGRTVPMDRFRTEFWIEYGHRALAKIFGLLWLAALAWIALTPVLRREVLTLFLVASGILVVQVVLGGIVVLQHTPALNVSIHLTTAFLFVACVVWMTLKLQRDPEEPVAERAPGLTTLAWLTSGVCIAQVFLGGLMAKTNAARIESLATWPKMGEVFVPPRDALIDPTASSFLVNFVTNPYMIQFVHRWFAFVVVAMVIALAVKCLRLPLSPMGRWTIRATVFFTAFQVIVGIFTLLYMVPIELGVLHLSTGLVVFLLLIVMVYEIRHNSEILALEERQAARLEHGVEATA